MMSDLVLYPSQPHSSLAGPHRARQGSLSLNPDLALLDATSPKGAAQERRGAAGTFGAYHLLYLQEGERPRPPRSSPATHPAVTALDVCGAVCAAIGGLGEPEAPQPLGAHMSKLDASPRSCCARGVSADCGRDWCRGWLSRPRGACLVCSRSPVGCGCSGLCFVPAGSHICSPVIV